MIFKVDENSAEMRLDRFLRNHYKEFPLSFIYKMLRNGKVKVNGRKKKENYRLKEGDELILPFASKEKEVVFYKISDFEKKELKQMLIFENNEIGVLEKPGNFVVHKGSGHTKGIIELLKAYYGRDDIALINRLDKATSGLLLFAKGKKNIRKYNEYMREGKIEKYYFVVSEGEIREERIVFRDFLAKGEKKVVFSDDGKEAITEIRVLKRNGKMVLLEAAIKTGRTHQIRVQLAKNKLPILGDYRYGVRKGNFMALFSHRIIIEKENIDIDLDLPQKFQKLFERGA